MPTEDVKTPLATDKTLKQLIDVVKNISLKSDIYNGLDSESSTRALSALQGKILNDNKFDKTNVYNGLDKTVSGFALDARQGKALNDSINAIMSFSDTPQKVGKYGNHDVYRVYQQYTSLNLPTGTEVKIADSIPVPSGATVIALDGLIVASYGRFIPLGQYAYADYRGAFYLSQNMSADFVSNATFHAIFTYYV